MAWQINLVFNHYSFFVGTLVYFLLLCNSAGLSDGIVTVFIVNIVIS